MDEHDLSTTRRTLIRGLAIAPAAALVAGVGAAQAAGNIPQSNAKYQNHPMGKNQCSKCIQYIPGKTATANGQCKLVAGVISPNGWCQLFAPKAAG